MEVEGDEKHVGLEVLIRLLVVMKLEHEEFFENCFLISTF